MDNLMIIIYLGLTLKFGEKQEYVLDALNSMISGGPYIDKFEFF